MTWSLEATGHAIVDDVEGAAQALESELVEELHKVLSNPRWGTLVSRFTGAHITADVHTAPDAGAVDGGVPAEQPAQEEPAAPAEAAEAEQDAPAETQTAAPAPDAPKGPAAEQDAAVEAQAISGADPSAPAQ